LFATQKFQNMQSAGNVTALYNTEGAKTQGQNFKYKEYPM